MKKISVLSAAVISIFASQSQAAADFTYGRAGIASLPGVKAGWNSPGWSDSTVVEAKVFSANSTVNLPR